MQGWERPRHRGCPVTTTNTTRTPRSHHPSFSSILLDAIDRSMDEDSGAVTGGPTTEQPRRITVDAPAMRKSATVTQNLVTWRRGEIRVSANSASTSSRSISSGGFSSPSSESDAVALPTPRPLKPIRITKPPGTTPTQSWDRKTTTEGYTRFPESEFYGELRRTKPPLSPGARLASFLANLFAAAGKRRKVKNPTAANSDASSRSSQSSCTRSSCLVKTSSSMGKTPPRIDDAAKRSVRFYTAGAETPPLPAFRVGQAPSSAAEERKRAEKAARELAMRRYTKKMGAEEEEREEEEEDDDGGGSYSSSDLFELENMATISRGGGRDRVYMGELPVYGTTRLGTNRAIARRLVL